jgi:chaperone modulatory protein CbpM
MTASNEKTLTGELCDDGSEITVIELCRVCAVDAQLVDELIAEGILEPTSSSAGTTVLPYSSVRRTRTVIRMQRDLGVNLPGAAVALDLIERIHVLRARIRMR